MNEPRQVVYTPVIEDGEYVDFDRDEKMEEENAEFEQFKSEMHDAQFDAKITVGKKLTDSSGRPLGRQIFECFECAVDDYTFSQLCTRIREDFGTGLYQIQGRDSKGKYKFKKTVGILAPNTPDNAPAGNDIGALINNFSDAMERQQMRLESMFKSMSPPQSGSDAFDQITKMMTAMGGMMGAMGITPQQQAPPKTLAESLQEFALIKELIGSGGDSGGDANLYSLLTATVQNFGPLLSAALSAGQKDGSVSPAGIIQPEIPVLPQPQGEIVTNNPEKERLEAMKPQLEFLLSQSKGGAKPNDVADFVIKMIPENQLESMEDFLLFENCVDLCIQVLPGIAEVREWFEQWQTEMLKRLDKLLSDSEMEPELPLVVDDEIDQSILEQKSIATEPVKEKVAKKKARKKAAKKTKRSSGVSEHTEITEKTESPEHTDLTDESGKVHDSPTVTGDDGNGKQAIATGSKREADKPA